MLKSYVKRIISVILFISLSGCMSADPRESKYTISIEKFDWDFERASAFENDSLHISMVPTKNSSAVFDFIATKYAVDKESSARRYLSNTYEVCLLELKNKTSVEHVFYLNKLYCAFNGKSVSPLSPIDLPSEIRRINPKGISKNIYNSVVIVTMLAAISSALLAMGDGDMKPTGVEAEVLSTPEIWSSIFHKTHLKYEDLILQKNPIAPNKCKSGLVFIPRGKYRINELKLMYR